MYNSESSSSYNFIGISLKLCRCFVHGVLFNGDFVGCLFVDFKKAFDVIDHSILLKKLINYRFNCKFIAWFTSYLSDRQQAVVHRNGLSAFTYMNSAVPQGSILEPSVTCQA